MITQFDSTTSIELMKKQRTADLLTAGLLNRSTFAVLEKIARVVLKQCYILDRGHSNFASIN